MRSRRTDVEIDLARREVRRDGAIVPVQRKVFDLLAFFAEHPDRAVSRGELLAAVWGDVVVTEASLNQAIRNARKAIGDDPAEPARLLTLRGFGYRWASRAGADGARPSVAPGSEEETIEHGGAPPVSGHAHLVVVAAANGAAIDRGIVSLAEVERVDIGRTGAPARERDGARVVVGAASPTLSRRHAWITRREDGAFVLEDGGSKNGTLLSGRRVERAPLEDGDWIVCGPLVLRFRRASGPIDDARSRALRDVTCDPRLAAELGLAARVLAEGGPVVLGAHEGADVSRLARAIHALAGRRGPKERAQLRTRRGADAIRAIETGMASCEGGTLLVLGLDAWTSAELSSVAAHLEPESEREVPDVALVLAASLERAPELAARLGAHHTHVPPLAERSEDLGLLLELALPEGASLAWSSEALARLTQHDWPGDERELGALVRRSLASGEGVVSDEALPALLRQAKSGA